MRKKWDLESVTKEAKKYEYRKDFRKQSIGAYKSAQRNGWLDIVCNHMTLLWEKKWTYESLILEAKKYKYKSDFRNKSVSAYNAAFRNGYLSDIYKILKDKPNKWNFKTILEEAKKFNTRKEFQIKSQSAYNAARKNNILNDVCKHMKALKGIWTLQEVTKKAKEYTSRTEFSKKSSSAYASAQRNGWLDDVCAHMRNPRIRWTNETLELEANKYTTRTEFKSNSESAYQSARKLGILNEICAHMHVQLLWTFDRVYNEALKYNNRTEFSKKSSGAYSSAKKNSWLDNVCSHMETFYKEWSYEAVLNEAKKYKYRSDFQNNSLSAYSKARNMGWLKECQIHMINRPIKWTEETIANEAIKYESRSEFALGSGSAYKAASDKGIIDDVCKHMKILYNGFYHCVYAIINESMKKAYIGITSQKFELRMQQHRSENNPCNSKEIAGFTDTIFKQLTDYIYTAEDVREFAEQQYVDQFKADEYIVLNNSKSIGNVGYSRRKWTIELCHIEALKYNMRWDFQKYSVNAYTAAKNHNWLEQICSHMESTIKPSNYWSKEKCIDEAKKYKSIKDFKKHATYPYKIMFKNGWSEEVCAHFPVLIYKKWEKQNSNPEIWKKAQDFYNTWIELDCCSGYILSKEHKLTGNKLNLMVAEFQKSWIPRKDKLWVKWVSQLDI